MAKKRQDGLLLCLMIAQLLLSEDAETLLGNVHHIRICAAWQGGGETHVPLLTFSSENVLMVRRGQSRYYTATHNTLDLHKAASSSLSSLQTTGCNGVHLLFHYYYMHR